MFLRVKIRDKIRILPDTFNRCLRRVVIEVLDAKYANRVIPDVGLCIATFRLDVLGDGKLFPGDGAAHVEVVATLLVFRPFEGELVEGQILSSDLKGVRVTLGFFDDVLIPPSLFNENTTFDHAEKIWVWQYRDGDTVHPLYFDHDHWLRFRVHTVRFTTTAKTKKGLVATTKSALSDSGNAAGASKASKEESPVPPAPVKTRTRSMSFDLKDESEAPPPMTILGSVMEDGLGCVEWWG